MNDIIERIRTAQIRAGENEVLKHLKEIGFRDEQDLKKRQAEHLKNVRGGRNWQPCLHDGCSECFGTGVRRDGTACVHNLSCSCPKCSPYT
jgi:hypothetical protein